MATVQLSESTNTLFTYREWAHKFWHHISLCGSFRIACSAYRRRPTWCLNSVLRTFRQGKERILAHL